MICSLLAGRPVRGSTIRELLQERRLSQPRGRFTKSGRAEQVEPHPLAGAELLLAVEQDLGAVRSLTEALGEHLGELPAPEGEVRDELSHGDERGRFLSFHNEPSERTETEVGERFDSVELRRTGRDLR